MRPHEVWLIFDAKRPRKMYGEGRGAMTEDEVRELYREAYGEPPEED